VSAKAKVKPPRCGARWKVGSRIGLRRPCNKLATAEAVVVGSTVAYCPEHAADRRSSEARHVADQAARDERKKARLHVATECAAHLETLMLPAGAPWNVPEDCEVVVAVRCACGDVFGLDRFPEHFARCADSLDEEERRGRAQAEAQLVQRAERVLEDLERRAKKAKAAKDPTRLVPVAELAKHVWSSDGDAKAEVEAAVRLLVEEGLVVTSTVRGATSVALAPGVGGA
jgi:hypothetical protein